MSRRALSLPARALRYAWRRAFFDRHYVWLCDDAPRPPPAPGALRVTAFERLADVPADWLAAILAHEGRGGDAMLRAEFARHAKLWVGHDGDRVAGYQWSRRGRHVARWFVELAPDDVVLFGTETLPAQRGRGIAPYLMAHVIERERAAGGRAWIDCKVWNRAAIRAFEKAGFRRVAERPPL